MTLREWLERTGHTEQWLADAVGEPVHEVRSWVSGRVRPNPVQRQLVSSVTRGEVTWDALPNLARGSRP